MEVSIKERGLRQGSCSASLRSISAISTLDLPERLLLLLPSCASTGEIVLGLARTGKQSMEIYGRFA
jgi:hypothetical protein